MRFYIPPFGYIPTKYVLAFLFAVIAFVVIFYRVIINLTIVILFGLVGWCLGLILDDPIFMAKVKYRLRNVFSKKP